MPSRRAALLLALGALLAAPAAPAAAATSAVVARGLDPTVTVDGAGTAYIAYKTPAEDVGVCILPPGATACASNAVVEFPGADPGNNDATVLLPGPGVVELVTVRRTASAQTYLSRSTDGGRSFGKPVQILDGFSQRAARLADGRIVLAEGLVALNAAVVRPDGSDEELGSTRLTDEGFLEAAAGAAGNDAFAAAADAFGPTRSFRLPAGGDGADPNQWEELPLIAGTRQPRLAGGPAGLAMILEPTAPQQPTTVRRLLGSTWSAPVAISDIGSGNSDFALGQGSGDGRLDAVVSQKFGSPRLPSRVEYSTSADGGTLWSPVISVVRPAGGGRLSVASGGGRTVAVEGSEVDITGDDDEPEPVQVISIDPREAPARTVRVGDAFVQLSARCARRRTVSVSLAASRGGVRVSPSAVLRSARFSVRRARFVSVRRFGARARLRRARSAGFQVRLTPSDRRIPPSSVGLSVGLNGCRGLVPRS